MEHDLLIMEIRVDGFCPCLPMSDVQPAPKPEEEKEKKERIFKVKRGKRRD